MRNLTSQAEVKEVNTKRKKQTEKRTEKSTIWRIGGGEGGR